MWLTNPKSLITTGAHAARALKLVPRSNFEKIGKPIPGDSEVVGHKTVDANYKVGGKMFRCRLAPPPVAESKNVGDWDHTQKFEAFW